MKKLMKAIAAIMLMTVVVCIAGCTKPDGPNNGGNDGNGGNNNGGGNNGGGNGGSINGFEYVDLGLPSGTMWATYNVGATSPEDFGYYFAWGETQPKEKYYWDTYKWCNGEPKQLTKYCNYAQDGFDGYTDNLIVLQASDDVATDMWGSGWRMSTREEWMELVINTTATWTTLNGVNGTRFTSANGNSIFLPAAGSISFDYFAFVGEQGYYWSGSLNEGNPQMAWGFYIGSDGCSNNGAYSRYYGYVIRPVHSAN